MHGQTTARAVRPARHPGDANVRAAGSLGHAAARAQEIKERARGIAGELRDLEMSLVGSRPSDVDKDKPGAPIEESYAGRLAGDLEGIDGALGEIMVSIGRIREAL